MLGAYLMATMRTVSNLSWTLSAAMIVRSPVVHLGCCLGGSGWDGCQRSGLLAGGHMMRDWLLGFSGCSASEQSDGEATTTWSDDFHVGPRSGKTGYVGRAPRCLYSESCSHIGESPVCGVCEGQWDCPQRGRGAGSMFSRQLMLGSCPSVCPQECVVGSWTCMN